MAIDVDNIFICFADYFTSTFIKSFFFLSVFVF